MRADVYLTAEKQAASRTLAQKLIADGAVRIDGRLVKKPSEEISDGVHTIEVAATADTRYVGRGGLKLEAALAAFPLDPRGRIVADVGASTGGFTDCLLQNGARRVYAIDAGHDQLHPTLRVDPRVRMAEGCNARALTPEVLRSIESVAPSPDPSFDGRVDGAVMDVSFISQTLLLPALTAVIRPGGWLVSLIKPQFELSGAALGKHGIVRKDADRQRAVDRVLAAAGASGFVSRGVVPSPIEGGDGNREFLAFFVRSED